MSTSAAGLPATRTDEPATAGASSGDRPAVGFIGLGIMGAPMAGHIAAAGHDLHVTARRAASARSAVEAGATWHATARELAARCDVVVVMVPDLPDIDAVLDGPDGLLAGVQGPLVLVVSSTVAPDGIRELARRLLRSGAPRPGHHLGYSSCRHLEPASSRA